MPILFNRTARLHIMLACVRLSLVFISLFACVLCAHGFGFLHDVHSLVTGSELGDMFAPEVLEKENFASSSAKQNEEAALVDALMDLQERKDRRRDFNDAWIVQVTDYYRDTKTAPGERGIQGLRVVIENRGLDGSKISQFKHAEDLLSEAYENSDFTRLPQMGEPVTLDDGQVCMFLPPDIMGQEMLLEYAGRLVDLAEQSAGRNKLAQFRELIEKLSALSDVEITGMSITDKENLRGTVLYWQDVVLNHFEKAEKKRIMGLSSVSSGPCKPQSKGSSLRDELVLTDGSPGLKANPEAGRFQKWPQYALKDAKGQAEMLNQGMTGLFGKPIYLMTAVSKQKRPSWPGLKSLPDDEKVKIMVTCVITGSISDTKGRLFVEAMETMPPYYLHKLTMTEANTAAIVTSYKAAFKVFKIDPARIVYQIGSLSEEEKSRRLDLSQEESWFQLVLSQRGLLIDHSDIVGDEGGGDTDAETSNTDDEGNTDAVLTADPKKGIAARKMKSALEELDLVAQLRKMGIEAPLNTAAGQEDLQKLKQAQVLSSLKNLEPMPPGTNYPVPKVMLKGGQNADPVTGEETIQHDTTQIERLHRAHQVGTKNSGNEGTKGLFRKFCLACNTDKFLEHLKLTGVEPSSLTSLATKGLWRLPLKLVEEIKYTQDSTAWFCPDCPARTGATGKPLLMPGPGARMACPGKHCAELLESPAGRVIVACSRCGLCFGSGEVTAIKHLSISDPLTWAAQKTKHAELALALVYSIGGTVNVKRNRQVLGLTELLCIAACNPAAYPDHPPIVFTNRLIVKLAALDFSLTSDFPSTGQIGLHLSDFQKHGSDLPTRLGLSPDDLMEIVAKKPTKAEESPPPWGFSVLSSDATKVLHIEAAMQTACETLAWVYGTNFTTQTKVALAAAAHEILTLHRQQFTPARTIALYQSIIADFFRRIHLQVRDWSSDQRYGIEIPREGSEAVGHISMLYFRNGQLPLTEVWGPETVAASVHANKAFTSVSNCADSKPRKPSDSSTGLGAVKLEEELPTPSTPKGLPAPKPKVTFKGDPLLPRDWMQVQWSDMTEAEKAKKRAHDISVKATKQTATEAAQVVKATTTGVDAKPEKNGKGKGGKGKGGREQGGKGRSTAGKPDFNTGKDTKQEVKAQPDIPLKVGREITESAWQVPAKWAFSVPYDHACKRSVCPDFQTLQGCIRPSGVPCHLSHIIVDSKFWPIAFWPAFLSQGGHKDQGGLLSWAGCMSLLEPHQRKQLDNLGELARSYYLQNHTLTLVNNMIRAVGDHTPWSPLENDSGVCLYKVWGDDSPFPVASPSGLPIVEVWAATLGKINLASMQTFALRGYMWDLGSEIKCPGGHTLHQACVLLATAAMLAHPLQCPQVPSYAASFVLAQQFFNDIAAIPLSEVLRLKNTRLASVYHGCSLMEQQGLPDSAFMLLKRGSPKILQGHHVVTLGQDPEDKSKFVVRLFLADNAALKEELWGTHKVATTLKQKLSDEEYARLGSLKVLWVANLVHGANRHAYCFNQNMSFSETLQWLGRLQDSWLATVVIARIGMREFLSTQPATSVLLECELQEAYNRIQAICAHMSKDCLPSLVSKTGLRKQQQAATSAITQKLVDTYPSAYAVNTATSEAPSDRVTGSTTVPEAGKREAQNLSTSDRVIGYSNLLASLTVSADSSTSDKAHALRILGEFLNEWLLEECHKVGNKEAPSKAQCRAALTTLVSSLRKQWFGDRASEGPKWEDIEKVFGKTLSTHHLMTLKELVERGGNPIFMGPARGYQAKAAKHMEAEVVDIVVSDYLALVQAKRGLPFHLGDPKIKELLLQAGVRMCPLVPVKKNNPDGTWSGKWRCCHNATDGGHTHAPNTGINSCFLSTQRCTNTQACARAVLAEEHKHKNSIILLSKTDLTKAFNRIANLEALIGMFASLLEEWEICFLNLVCVFGAGSSPGLFDGLADAIVQTLMLLVRPEPLLTGELPAEVTRYVDDFLSVTAAFGFRVPTSQMELHKLIQQLLGEDGINMEKRGVEGTPQVVKQCFGGTLNTVRRTVMMPMSKGVKAYNLVEDFMYGRKKTLTVKTVQQFVGVCEVILLWAGSLKKIVCPRLYAILSRAALKFPNERAPPGDAVIAPMLKDEEDEAGAWETLRFNLKLFFSLMSIEEGKLFQVSLEAALPRKQRRTYPGKEDSRWDISFVSDASGSAVCIIDPQTGRYIQEKLTEAEMKLFQVSVNSKGGSRKGATTINNLEHLATLWAAVVLAPAYPGRMVTFYLDNATAEAMQAGSSQEKVVKDEQISALIGLIGICMQISFGAERVDTKSNVADFFTREKHDGAAAAYLERLEKEIGIKPVRIPLTGELQWLREMGWTEEEWLKKPNAWYGKALKAFDYIQGNFPQQLREGCRVQPNLVREKLSESLKGENCVPISDSRNDSEPRGFISEVRRNLTEPVRKTHTMLLRDLKRLGTKQWLASVQAEAEESPMMVITQILEKQYQRDSAVLRVRNKSFDPTLKPGLPSTPLKRPNWEPPRRENRMGPKVNVGVGEEEVQQCVNPECGGKTEFGPALWVRKVGDTNKICDDCRWVASVNTENYRWVEKWNVASLFSGMGSFEEAATLVTPQKSQIISVSDFCPVMQKILRLKFPEAQIHEKTQGILEGAAKLQERLEVLAVSLPCVAFSVANLHAKGARDSLFTENLSDTIKVISVLKPLSFFLECAPGINVGSKGDCSVVEQLREQLKEYRLDVFKLGSSQVSSPLVSDGFEKSPIHKESMVILGYLSPYFSNVTDKAYLEKTTPGLSGFEHILDPKGREPEFYEQMPLEDQEALEFKPRLTTGGVFVIGNISQPTAGRGEANFPNEVVDPSLGLMPCITTQGALWMGTECVLQGAVEGLEQRGASCRKPSIWECIRALGTRGLDNSGCLEVLAEFPAAARRMVGNAPAQPLYDQATCQMQRNMSQVQPDGETAWEKWKKENANREAPSLVKSKRIEEATQQLEELRNLSPEYILRECPRGHSAHFLKSSDPSSPCDNCRWADCEKLIEKERTGLVIKEFSTGARNRNTARKPEVNLTRKEEEVEKQIALKAVEQPKVKTQERRQASKSPRRAAKLTTKCQIRGRRRKTAFCTVTELQIFAECEAELETLNCKNEGETTETDEGEGDLQTVSHETTTATVTTATTDTVTVTETVFTTDTVAVTDAVPTTATAIDDTNTVTNTATDPILTTPTVTVTATVTSGKKEKSNKFWEWAVDDDEDESAWASEAKRAKNTENHLYEKSPWRPDQRGEKEAIEARNQRVSHNGASRRRERAALSASFEVWPEIDSFGKIPPEAWENSPLYPKDHSTGSKTKPYAKARTTPEITESIETKIQEFIHEVLMHGKSPNTEKNYTSAERHWVEAFTKKNWDPFFRDVAAMNTSEAEKIREKTQRCLWYVAYESQVHGIMGRSIQNKLSAVTWLFVKNYLPNPFEDLYTLKTFMTDLKKRDPSAIPKAPATPQLLSLILMFVDQGKWDGLMFKVILLVAFWYMMRSAECVSSDKRMIDRTRVLLWRNVVLRSSMEIDAKVCMEEEFEQGTVMTLDITSTKNKLGRCTRTIEESDSELCAVKAMKELHAKIKEDTGCYPHPDQAICEKSSKEFLTRDEVSKVLQAAALQCGVSAKMVASHSLRRGGATTYSLAGVPDEDIKRFGRWLSDAYKLYVFLGMGSIMSKGQSNPMVVVPRFERN